MTKKFFTNNWKTLLFPFIILGIILFDTLLNLPLVLTVLKIFFVAMFHALVVYKTNYIYDSEIYKYYIKVDTEYKKNFFIKALLSSKQKNLLFLCIFLLGNCTCVMVNTSFSYTYVICIILCIFGTIFIIDFCYEVIRTMTNQTNFSKINVELPPSLKGQTKRYMFSMATQIMVKHGPLCAQLLKGTATLGAITEFGLPTVSGGPNNIGLLTSFYVNKVEYPHIIVPIETRCDIIYEHAYKGYENDVTRGYISKNPLEPRTNSIRSFNELAKKGLDFDVFSK